MRTCAAHCLTYKEALACMYEKILVKGHIVRAAHALPLTICVGAHVRTIPKQIINNPSLNDPGGQWSIGLSTLERPISSSATISNHSQRVVPSSPQ